MAEKQASPTIELSGFKDIDSSSRDIVKTNVERHAKKISTVAKNFQNLHITLKTLHQREKSEIYDIHARLKDNGKFFVSHVSDRNLFAAVDLALEKLLHELGRK